MRENGKIATVARTKGSVEEYAVTDSIPLADSPRGYRRSDQLQDEFLAAAETLRQHDGWPNPNNAGVRELRADLALEGGGVKGVGLSARSSRSTRPATGFIGSLGRARAPSPPASLRASFSRATTCRRFALRCSPSTFGGSCPRGSFTR